MITVLSILGTRPEAIKMAPVIKELNRYGDEIHSVVCSTGQHRQMLDQALQLFDIVPDIDLGLMTHDQSLAGLTARLFLGLDEVIEKVSPDIVLAQGDTTSVLVASLVSFYRNVLFGHVEAGLRTGDKRRPYPEEINRRVADVATDIFFAPTERSRQALIREGHSESDVFVTGNTVIDALLTVANREYDWSSGPLAILPRDSKYVLITAHRRESFGEQFRQLCFAIRDLADEFRSAGYQFVYPVHLNPNVRAPVGQILADVPNIVLMEPLDYLPLAHLMKASTIILTDSGGIQEEAPSLGVPVLVMRDTTERPEGVDAGVARLIGTSREQIVAHARLLLSDPRARDQMVKNVNPYGDGQAAQRIIEIIRQRVAINNVPLYHVL